VVRGFPAPAYTFSPAGAVTATGLVATALAGPWVARLIDRHGQARVAVPATACAVLGSLALLLCVRFNAPDRSLFAAYAATATTPDTGGTSRARRAHPPAVTALLTGISCGSAAGGWCAEHLSATAGLTVPVFAAWSALLLGTVATGRP
jgi:MFS family permease